MNFTAIQNLPCPEGTDMAGVALYMQCLAEQIEATLQGQADQFTTFLTPPVAVWTRSTPQTLVDGDQLAFSSVTSAHWPVAPSPTSPSLPNLRGWYYIGADVNIVDAPAAVDQSRVLVLFAEQNVGIIGDPTLATFVDTVFESNTGGENLLVAGTVFFASGDFTATAPVDLSLYYRTSGGAGNPVDTTLTPAIRLWVVYLGDTPEIGAI